MNHTGTDLKSNARLDSVRTTAGEMAAQLRLLRDPGRARGMQAYFKNEITALGISTPVLRKFVRERVQELRLKWQLTDAIGLCDCLLQESELEIRGAGLLVLGGFEKRFSPAVLKPARRWLETRLDNWALVDGFCSAVLSPLLKRHPGMEKTLWRWSDAKSLWVRRAALVTLVPFARHGMQLDMAYRMVSEHFTDPEDLMHKAMGWLLRDAGKKDMRRLKRYLLEHGPAIPRTTVRYAIERFPVETRTRLLAETRKL